MSVKNLFLFLFSLFLFTACNSSTRVFGDKKTPHEVYAKKVEDKPLGKQWVETSLKILAAPQLVRLPYTMKGLFPAGKPRALALEFSAKRGEHVNIQLAEKITGSIVCVDIFKLTAGNTEHLVAADTELTSFGYDVDETGNYLVRLQPEMEKQVEYTFSMDVVPSLGFPVAGGKARVGSVWGDSRDNGKRSHEGIDIFAPKLTPAIAAADGYISAVKEGGLGGKTIHLKVASRSLSLYYAHLDKQLVSEGQYVKKGDTLGLVGNTGNARTTPPHLHFGIYSFGGPIDPLPFVNKPAKAIPALPSNAMVSRLKLIKPVKNKLNEPIAADTWLIPLAITPDSYVAELPNGEILWVPIKLVKALS